MAPAAAAVAKDTRNTLKLKLMDSLNHSATTNMIRATAVAITIAQSFHD
jgi:hypothetical protein